MSGSACNAYQIRKIYAIGGALGMVKRGEDDDLLHELVNGMTGKTSIKELTYGEACKVIGELEGRQGTPPPRKSGRPLHKNVPGRASEGQQRKIWALMYKLQAASPSKAPIGDRLCAIIKKELGIDAVPKNPFAWIDYKGGNKLVEVLKGYVKTAQGVHLIDLFRCHPCHDAAKVGVQCRLALQACLLALRGDAHESFAPVVGISFPHDAAILLHHAQPAGNGWHRLPHSTGHLGNINCTLYAALLD